VVFDLAAAGLLEPTADQPAEQRIRSLRVGAAAGGRGHTEGSGREDGDPVPGWDVSVLAPGEGGWLRIGGAEDVEAGALRSGVDLPIDWSCGEAWCERATLDRLIGPDGTVTLDLAPRAPQGSAPEDGVVELDYVELRVGLHVTGCRVPGGGDPLGTPDGAPCDDGDPATDGEICRRFTCSAR